jgi:RNA polymerase sigma-70 factor (ECF subfamily)
VLEHYYQELLNFIARSTGCRDKAQDVVQESYARVLAAHADKPPAQPRALLYATARHLLIDQHRQQQRYPQAPLDEACHAAAPASEPERTVAAQQDLQQLLDTIAQLPPRCRQAFVLYKFDGLSTPDIARRMGISVNMVEKHLINGMLACKKSMAGQDAP